MGKGPRSVESWKSQEPPSAAPSTLATCKDRANLEVVSWPATAATHSYSPAKWPYPGQPLGAALPRGAAGSLLLGRGFAAGSRCRPLDMLGARSIHRSHRSSARSAFSAKWAVAHVGIADPFCRPHSAACWAMCREPDCHRAASCTAAGNLYSALEGPALLRPGRIQPYRSLGCSVIGNGPQPQRGPAWPGKPRCLATLAMGTDYDCWHAENTPR